MNFAALTPGYDNTAVQKTLEEMKENPVVATFGTDLLDTLTNIDTPLPLTPWKTSLPYGDYTLCVRVVDEMQPLQIALGEYTFYPIVNIKQENWDLPTVYYEWFMGHLIMNGDAYNLGPWKLVWGGDLDTKPSYHVNETPMDDLNLKKLTITITKMPGYSASVYYQNGVLYFVLFPLDFPGLNVTANYGNNDTLYKCLQDELEERQFTVTE